MSDSICYIVSSGLHSFCKSDTIVSQVNAGELVGNLQHAHKDVMDFNNGSSTGEFHSVSHHQDV